MKKIGVTELVLRDGHQSLLATRLKLEDMLPIAAQLDEVGYWSIESWGGATFDACIRFLHEDPWERLRLLKQAMPKTPQQMLLRGQNLLGYRHYADDVVDAFVARAAEVGVDVFRIFDALNDPRNLQQAITAVKRCNKHAQATLSYTTSPNHTEQTWVDFAQQCAELGADSLAIKDMSGLLLPNQTYTLVKALKAATALPIHIHSHATTGLSTAAILKAIEAGADVVDAAISPFSQTYSHSATETIVAMLEGSEFTTDIDLQQLEPIAAYFRAVRHKYSEFEGSLQGIDARILTAQVPGGMLTNLESQLKEQQASDKFDQILAEIPLVRADLGYIPLVTPTSQIVGTQALLNVLSEKRYERISRETEALVRGEYGLLPAPVAAELQQTVLGDAQPITHRPADDLASEFHILQDTLAALAVAQGFAIENIAADTLTYALFPQVATQFFKQRGLPLAAQALQLQRVAVPDALTPADAGHYRVTVAGKAFNVVVESQNQQVTSVTNVAAIQAAMPTVVAAGNVIQAPLTGQVFKVLVRPGQRVENEESLLILEAMKMETPIKSTQAGMVQSVFVQAGDAVQVGDALVEIA